MAASLKLHELLKPVRFDADPNSPKAAKQLKHWLKVFGDFLDRCDAAAEGQDGAAAPNKLQILFAYVSPDVYEYIEGSDTYDAAIAQLKSVFIKTPNVIFARHQLATKKQQPGETLEDFFQSLQILSKDCQLRAVTAEEHRNDLVRDAFINGLSSHSIRQRLLENNELTVAQAFDKARSLRTAQEHSEAYLNRGAVAAIMPHPEIPAPAAADDIVSSSTFRSNLCGNCGFSFHQRNQCPAREVTCYSCGKKGHFSKVCRSKSHQTRQTRSRQVQSVSSSISQPLLNLCSVSAACPASLIPATLKISINGTKLTALVDSGSSESYIGSNVCTKLKLDAYPATHQVQMASTAMKIKSTGFCLADINIGETQYPSTRLNILENLCSDVILGLDFQSQHQHLVIHFN